MDTASTSCDVPVYVPAFAGTKLYCLVIGAQECEQLAQSRYAAARPVSSDAARIL